jgi:hypothetical protein
MERTGGYLDGGPEGRPGHVTLTLEQLTGGAYFYFFNWII